MEALPSQRTEPSVDEFAAFYDRAIDEVYRYVARGVFGNRSLAEDLTQETFMAAMQASRAGRPEAHSIAWVLGIARHKLIDQYRRDGRDQRHLRLVWSTERGDDVGFEQGLDPSVVVGLLADLDPAYRMVIVLRYLDDLPVAEISRLIGRSVHATESLLVRSRKALAELHRKAQS